MKKLIVIGILLCLPLISIALAQIADVEIILVIPGSKVADFSAGFLAKCPIPMTADPDNIGEMVPQYTAKQWIKEWIRRDVLRAYKAGKVLLAKQTAISDPNAIQ